MTDISSSPPLVIAVAPVPPPLHGAAATTQSILDYLVPKVAVQVANVAPANATGLPRHLSRIWRTIKALALLAGQAATPNRVLYMTADGGPGMIYNIAVAALGTVLGYRVFLHHHSFAYIDRQTTLMSILSRILARSGTHIVLCEAMADGLKALYPISATLELSSAAVLPIATRSRRRPDAPFKMGFLSNLIVEKGLDTSIDLLRAARAEGLPVRLVIAGRAPDRRPLDLIDAARAEFNDSLEYLGPLSDEEKEQFLGDLDVFLFPSRYFNEAQPRAVLESLAHGVPVLTIARSCITADMGVGTGLCVPTGMDFVEAALPFVRQWVQDRASLVKTGDAAHERARALHDSGLSHLAALVNVFTTQNTARVRTH